MRHSAACCCRLLLGLCLAYPAPGADEAAVSGSVYESDMKAFLRTIDDEYPFFALKGIRDDWTNARPGFMERATRCASDEEFLRIVVDAIRVLRDGHMAISEAKAQLPALPPRYCPGVSFLPATEGRVVVMYAPQALAGTLPTGTIVTKIDGIDARQYLDRRAEAAWNEGGFFSSPQRARLFEYRMALGGEQGRKHTIHYRQDSEEQPLTLECNTVARGWPHSYNLPDGLKQVGRSFFYAKPVQDVGYMYLRRVDASVPEGIDEALGTYPNLKGWIVDLRGNGGGGYDSALLERIKRFPRPVAVLIDAGCVSAGETLARDLQALANARLFGSRTGGSSSSKRQWSFPSGIATLTIPVRSRWRNDKQPIEFNGIDPDVVVEAVPEELKAGNNSAILRAREYILRETPQRDVPDGKRTSTPSAALPEDSNRDHMLGWYKLMSRDRMHAGALIPILKIDGAYYTVCHGIEIPLKACPNGLEWALTPSSLEGTTIRSYGPSDPPAIRILDRQRASFEESYSLDDAPWIPMTRIDESPELLSATAPPPQSLGDFLGLYQPVWLPWARMEIRKDGQRHLAVHRQLDPPEPRGEWKVRGEPQEIAPLSDKLGFAAGSRANPQEFTYNETLRRFEIVLTNPGARMPLAKLPPGSDAAPPPLRIGIPAWH